MHQVYLARCAPCVNNVFQVTYGFVQGVDAALVQQLPHNLIGHLGMSKAQSKTCMTGTSKQCMPEYSVRLHNGNFDKQTRAGLVAPVVDGGHGDVVNHHSHHLAS